MVDVRTAHTADLDRTALDAAHSLLRLVFRDEWSAADWGRSSASCAAPMTWAR